MTEGAANPERDPRGRFAAGNPGGTGGARRRMADLRRAAEEAVTPEHVAALVRKATRQGLEGNLTATRLVLDRVCGRAAEAPLEVEPVNLSLPKLNTAADCGVAIERLTAAICAGTVAPATAQTLLAAVQARLRTIETTEFEQRLEQLERTAAQAEVRGPQNTSQPRFL
jgi:hypothetical protein